jgi:hypothetical protein
MGSPGRVRVRHDIKLPGGKTLKSYSFMRVQNGYFVKLRISGPPEGSQARLPGIFVGGVAGDWVTGWRREIINV